jgi:hypothetical protein
MDNLSPRDSSLGLAAQAGSGSRRWSQRRGSKINSSLAGASSIHSAYHVHTFSPQRD